MNCLAPSGFESADWIAEAPGPQGSPAPLPAYKSFPFSYLQYANYFGTSGYLANAPSGAVVQEVQSYIQGATSPPPCSTTTVFFCQYGIIPSQIFGSGNTSTFYPQYLADSVDAAPSGSTITPSSGLPGATVNGTYGLLNPSGYSIKKNTNYGTGGLTPINVSLEMGIVEAGGGSTTSVSVGSTDYYSAYDPDDGYLYVANSASNSVSVISGTSTVGSAISVGQDPLFPTFDPYSGYVYVPNVNSNTVSVLYGTSVVSGGTIRVGNSPHSVEYDPYNHDLYVANAGSSNVTVIAGLTVIANIPVGTQPLFAIPGGNYVYVPDSGGTSGHVSVISASTNVVTKTINTGLNPHFAVYDPYNLKTYVTNYGSNNVSVINGTSFVTTFSVGSEPNFATYDPENGYVYVVNQATTSTTVSVVSGNAVVAGGTVAVGTSPRFAIFDSSDYEVYVTNYGTNNVSVLGGSGGTQVVGTVSVGTQPQGLSFDGLLGYVYVDDSGGSLVTALNPAGGPSCYDTTHALSVYSGLVIASSGGKSSLQVCSGRPAAVYLYEFLFWWVPSGSSVGSSSAQLLGTSGWSYGWGQFFTVT